MLLVCNRRTRRHPCVRQDGSVPSRATAAESLIEQSRTLLTWLCELPDEAYPRPTVLAGWDVRMLVAHLVLIERGTVRVLGRPSPEKPLT